LEDHVFGKDKDRRQSMTWIMTNQIMN